MSRLDEIRERNRGARSNPSGNAYAKYVDHEEEIGFLIGEMERITTERAIYKAAHDDLESRNAAMRRELDAAKKDIVIGKTCSTCLNKASHSCEGHARAPYCHCKSWKWRGPIEGSEEG